jgi:hypothetical protein
MQVDESIWAMKGRDFGDSAAMTPSSNIPKFAILYVFIGPLALCNMDCSLESSLGSFVCCFFLGAVQGSSCGSTLFVPPWGCLWVKGVSPAENLFVSSLNIFKRFCCCLFHLVSGWDG